MEMVLRCEGLMKVYAQRSCVHVLWYLISARQDVKRLFGCRRLALWEHLDGGSMLQG